MKCLIGALITCLAICSPVLGQGAWDPDNNAPPPTSDVQPIPQPTKIKPFEFLFYQMCESQNDTVRYTGRWSFDILSKYGSVGFDHIETDTSVTLTLRTHNRGTREAHIFFPRKPFTLRVLLGRDTAAFAMDLVTGTCLYVDTSVLLRMISPKEIPANIFAMQFLDREEKRAKDFMKSVENEFGSSAEPAILEPGYYPCLPAFTVERAKLGRKQSVNATPLGLLVCFRLNDASRASTVSEWLWLKQREEFKRAGSTLGMKER